MTNYATLQSRIDAVTRIYILAQREQQQELADVAWEWQEYGFLLAAQVPEKGLAATICIGSDRYGATVTRVGRGRVWIKRDRAVRVDKNGLSEMQSYLHVIDDKAEEQVFYWAPTRKAFVNSSYVLRLGYRDSYSDPSF